MLNEKLKKLEELLNRKEEKEEENNIKNVIYNINAINLYSADNKTLNVEIEYSKTICRLIEETNEEEDYEEYEEEYDYETENYSKTYELTNVDYINIYKNYELLKRIMYDLKDGVKDYIDINNREITKSELEELQLEIVNSNVEDMIEELER